MKEFADDNFKFDENGRKLSKWVENTVGKGEIAHYEQFLLFPQCFQKVCFPGASLCGNGLTHQQQTAFENIVGTQADNCIPHLSIFFPIISLFAAELEEPKIGVSGKELNVALMMISVFDGVENTVGNGENCWLPTFSPFPTVIFKAFFVRLVKSWDCMAKR